MTERLTYILVDGENIDATLGQSVLGRRPEPHERPRWNVVLDHAERAWQQPVKGLFFLAVQETLPMSFVQALLAMGYTPVPLQGDGKVVDIAIQRTADALRARDADVMLVSHDGDFLEELEGLLEDERRVGVMAFREFRNSGFTALQADGLESFDLEFDVKAFTSPLPRIRVIPIEEFDPAQFL